MKQTQNSSVHSLLSRAGFAIAAVSLAGMLYGGCRREVHTSRDESAEPVEPGRVESSPSQLTPTGSVKGQVVSDGAPVVLEPQKQVPQGSQPTDSKAAPLKPVLAETALPSAKTIAQAREAPMNKLASVAVKRLVVTTGVEAREPAELTTPLVVGAPVVAFIEAATSAGSDSTVKVLFKHGTGAEVGNIELGVPAGQPRWRTWGKTLNIALPGEWTAEVLSASGEVLAQSSFTVSQ